MKKASVIVLNWNGLQHLNDCFSSLTNQTYKDLELIMVDNCSEDSSVKFVKSNFPSVKLLELDDNYGFCKGNNEGIKIATGEYIVLLNNDTICDPDFVFQLVKSLEQSDNIGSVASKMLFMSDYQKIDNVGIGFRKSGVGYKIGWLQTDNGQFDRPMYVFGSCAGAAIYRKEVFEKIGLLDELLQTNNEDIDFSFRMQLTGFECVYNPAAIVYHKVSATAGIKSKFTIYQTQRNLEIVYLKCMPSPYLLIYLPLHIYHSIASMGLRILSGHLFTVLKAKWDFIKLLPTVLKKRKQVQNKKIIEKDKIKKLFRKY